MPQALPLCKRLSSHIDVLFLKAENGTMTDTVPPKISAKGKAEASERQRRQAEALRANLARRKAQGRAREDAPPPADKDKAVVG
ncbi:conserved hypothetical protein [Candidatus Terasakiella magnetica]|nr:conserved hypothetical protein [Candidatus Terasakiella magnetica]